MLYVGLDVHRRRTQAAAADDEGHELFNRNVPNDHEKLGDVLVGFEPGTPVVFEATYGWAWLAELLDDGRRGPPGPPGGVQGDRVDQAEERRDPGSIPVALKKARHGDTTM